MTRAAATLGHARRAGERMRPTARPSGDETSRHAEHLDERRDVVGDIGHASPRESAGAAISRARSGDESKTPSVCCPLEGANRRHSSRSAVVEDQRDAVSGPLTR